MKTTVSVLTLAAVLLSGLALPIVDHAEARGASPVRAGSATPARVVNRNTMIKKGPSTDSKGIIIIDNAPVGAVPPGIEPQGAVPPGIKPSGFTCPQC